MHNATYMSCGRARTHDHRSSSQVPYPITHTSSHDLTYFQDQNAIQKLRDRVTQLDMENTALTKAAHHSNDSVRLYSNLDTDNVQAIVGQIKQLKSQLKTANEQSLRPAENIEGE